MHDAVVPAAKLCRLALPWLLPLPWKPRAGVKCRCAPAPAHFTLLIDCGSHALKKRQAALQRPLPNRVLRPSSTVDAALPALPSVSRLAARLYCW